MIKIYNLIIIILLVIIILLLVYLKTNKKENFTDAYNSKTINNLNNLNKALVLTKNTFNQNIQSNPKYTIFNYKKSPYHHLKVNKEEFNYLGKNIIKNINNNLDNKINNIEFLQVTNMSNVESGNQIKKEFNIIFNYKKYRLPNIIKLPKIIEKYNIKSNNTFSLYVNIISSLVNKEQIIYIDKFYINNSIDKYLPGSNYNKYSGYQYKKNVHASIDDSIDINDLFINGDEISNMKNNQSNNKKDIGICKDSLSDSINTDDIENYYEL